MSPNRRQFIKGVAAGVGSAAMTPLAGLGRTLAQGPATPPNVLVILSDQHRWQSLPFTETSQLLAPNLERLAREGFRFDHCVSNYPLCSPSRAMLMTGQWPQQTGVLDNSTRSRFALGSEQLTLGRAFQRAGYETGYIGKWHMGGQARSAEKFGFDHSIVWQGTNDHWNSTYIDESGKKRDSRLYNATHMTNQALAYIGRKRSSPFFLQLNWNPPHSNYTDAPSKFSNLYWLPESLSMRENVRFGVGRSKEEFEIQYRGYHSHITAIDFELGRLLGDLEARGELDNTLVVYVSDHGDALGSHDHVGKRMPYAECIRVPFIVRYPGKVAGNRLSDLPVGTIDFMPTLCALAGIPVPEGLPGSDYSGLATGKSGPTPESQLLMNLSQDQTPDSNVFPTRLFRGITNQRYTYAADRNGPWLLFDNLEDPLQLKNLVADEGHFALRKELHRSMAASLVPLGDTFLSS